jgi:hypothetical protein
MAVFRIYLRLATWAGNGDKCEIYIAYISEERCPKTSQRFPRLLRRTNKWARNGYVPMPLRLRFISGETNNTA